MDPTILIALLYVADKMISQFIVDKGYNPIMKLFFPKKKYIDQLQNVLTSTIMLYQEKYPPHKDGVQSRFYHSKVLFEYLSIQTFYKKHKFNPEHLINEFKKNPDIEIPNQEELLYFYDVFVDLVSNNERLKKLYLDENYQPAFP